MAPESLEAYDSEVLALQEQLRAAAGRRYGSAKGGDVVALEALQVLQALEEKPRSLSCLPLAKVLSEEQLHQLRSFLKEAKEARMWRSEAYGQYHVLAWASGHKLRLSVVSEDVPMRIAMAKVSIG